MIDIAAFLGLGTVLTGVTIWSIRQEGRINEHDRIFDEREKQNKAQQERASERHEDVKARLSRIESKLDNLNGRH